MHLIKRTVNAKVYVIKNLLLVKVPQDYLFRSPVILLLSFAKAFGWPQSGGRMAVQSSRLVIIIVFFLGAVLCATGLTEVQKTCSGDEAQEGAALSFELCLLVYPCESLCPKCKLQPKSQF